MDRTNDLAHELPKDKAELFRKVRAVLDMVKKDNIKYKVTIANQEDAIKVLNEQLTGEQNSIRQHVNTNEDFKMKAISLNAHNERLHATVDSTEHTVNLDIDSKQQIDMLNDEIRKLKDSEFKIALSELERKADKKELDEVKNERDQLVGEVTRLKATAFSYNGTCDHVLALKALVNKQTAQHGKDMFECHGTIKELKEQVERLQTSDNELEAQVRDKQVTIDMLTLERDVCYVQLEAAEKAFSKETEKLRTTEARFEASQVEVKQKDGLIAELVKNESQLKAGHDSVVNEHKIELKKVASRLADAKCELTELKSNNSLKAERINYLEPFVSKCEDLETKLKRRNEVHKSTVKELHDELDHSRTLLAYCEDALTISRETNKKQNAFKLELNAELEQTKAKFELISTKYDTLEHDYCVQSTELIAKTRQLNEQNIRIMADNLKTRFQVKNLENELGTRKFLKEHIEEDLNSLKKTIQKKDDTIKRVESTLQSNEKRYEKLKQAFEDVTKARQAESMVVGSNQSAKTGKDNATQKVRDVNRDAEKDTNN